MSRQPRQFMRQGVGDLPNRAAVDTYTGPRGEPIFDGETLRMHDGVTPGGRLLLDAPSFQIMQRLPITPQSFRQDGAFDGVQPDTAAISKALQAAAFEKRAFRLPSTEKPLICTTALNVTAPNGIIGDSFAHSRIHWPSYATSVGLVITQSADTESLVLEKLRLTRSGFGGRALMIDGSAQISSGHIFDRESPRLVLRDVYVYGPGVFNDGFDIGVELKSVLGAKLDGFNFRGRLNGAGNVYQSSRGIYAYGDGDPVELTILDPRMSYVNKGIETVDLEGVVVRGGTLVGVTTGILTNNQAADQPQLLVDGTHVNTQLVAIDARNMTCVTIANCTLFGIIDAPQDMVGLSLGAGTKRFSVTGTHFENTHATRSMIPISVAAASEGAIDLNTFSGKGPQAILLGPASSNVRVGGRNVFGTNIYGGYDAKVTDQGTGNVFVDAVLNAKGGAPCWRRDESGVLEQWGDQVVTLDANGVGFINLPLPYKSGPTYGDVTTSGDYLGEFSVKPVMSMNTAQRFYFKIFPNPGPVTAEFVWRTTGSHLV